MTESNPEKNMPVEIKGGTLVKTENETIYSVRTTKIEGDIYESIAYVINKDRAVIKLTSWTKGEDEEIEAVQKDGVFVKKENLGFGEIKVDEGYPDRTFKLVLDVSPTY